MQLSVISVVCWKTGMTDWLFFATLCATRCSRAKGFYIQIQINMFRSSFTTLSLLLYDVSPHLYTQHTHTICILDAMPGSRESKPEQIQLTNWANIRRYTMSRRVTKMWKWSIDSTEKSKFLTTLRHMCEHTLSRTPAAFIDIYPHPREKSENHKIDQTTEKPKIWIDDVVATCNNRTFQTFRPLTDS